MQMQCSVVGIDFAKAPPPFPLLDLLVKSSTQLRTVYPIELRVSAHEVTSESQVAIILVRDIDITSKNNNNLLAPRPPPSTMLDLHASVDTNRRSGNKATM